MGVIRNRVVIEHPNENSQLVDASNPPTDTESEAESVRPVLTYRRQQNERNAKSTFTDFNSFKTNFGKRKYNRFTNDKLLQIYIKDYDESEDGICISYSSPFERLMDITSNPIELLNEFTESLEEESFIPSESEKNKTVPFFRISNKIRKSIKKRRNFPITVAQSIEDDVIKFFKCDHKSIFVGIPSKSFERLYYHAVAQYHNLCSITLINDDHLYVKIFNNGKEWAPVETLLTDYIVENTIIQTS